MSSASSVRPWIYDVFLSFRGKDTRRNFVSHLSASLSNTGINTFIDDDNLEKGKMLKPELWRAIEGSKISIVVFSKNYAESSWCLDELDKIMECQRSIGQVVLPIFYDVSPSDVRYQTGTFGEVLDRLAAGYSGMMDVVSGWKSALTHASNLVGWDVRNCKSENKAVKEIVGAVLAKLDSSYLSITDFPVGLEPRVQSVANLLKGELCKVRIVGIWGMGGSGKTTIAKAIYNEIRSNFKDKSFLADIREFWEKDRGQIDLQEQLLSDIFKRKVRIHSIEWGKNMIKERLCGKRALILLDDVDKFEQLNALCGNRHWIGPGSVIIITTRDIHLLKVFKVDHVYEMKGMTSSESLELFSWHAFMDASPRSGFTQLSRDVVAYSEGLPLALEVLGSYLNGRTETEWQCVLTKLKRIPNYQIHKKLRISFDGLEDHMQKDIFLDICCFFIGMDKAYVTEILNGCELHAEIGITILIERSLIKIEKNNKLGVHDLLRDMGREIVRESTPKALEKQSRLWFHDDVLNVLTECSGTKAVEGLALQRPNRVFYTKAFENMKRLRLLHFDQVELKGDFSYLPKGLRWVCWQEFPFKCTPNNFYQGNMVAIELKCSNLRIVWKEPQILEKVKILNLSHSKYLTKTPDFTKLPNLEQLILKDCPCLSELHESVGDLNNLLHINMKDCTSVRNLPRVVYKLKSVKFLNISGCSMIDKLEEDIVQMESLTTLIAKDTAIKQVPFSIVRSKSIGYISLCGQEGLSRDVFPSFIWSWMSPAMNSLSCIHPFGSMPSSLVSMDAQIKYLSCLLKLRSVQIQCDSESQLTQVLRRMQEDLHDVSFTELKTSSYASEISQHSLRSLLIGMGSYYQVINAINMSILQGSTASGSSDFNLPGDRYPCWLTHTGEGHSVLFEVPEVSDYHMKGMILCVISPSTAENMADEYLGVFIVNHTKCIIQLYKRDTVISLNSEEWQDIVSNLGPGDKVEILVAFRHGQTIKKTAVYLIYGESIDDKMEHPPEPKNDALKPLKKRRLSQV